MAADGAIATVIREVPANLSGMAAATWPKSLAAVVGAATAFGIDDIAIDCGPTVFCADGCIASPATAGLSAIVSELITFAARDGWLPIVTRGARIRGGTLIGGTSPDAADAAGASDGGDAAFARLMPPPRACPAARSGTVVAYGAGAEGTLPISEASPAREVKPLAGSGAFAGSSDAGRVAAPIGAA